MKKKIIAKLVVQAVAAVFGALGLLWVGSGLHFVVSGIRDQDLFQMWYIPLIPLMFLLLGGYVITVAWWALRHFGAKAIQHVAGLIAFSAYTGMSMLLHPFRETTLDLKMELYYSLTFLIPMLLMYLLYRILSRKLIEMTETESIQQAEPTVPSKAILSASSDER